MDLENEAIINPKESELTDGFQARVASVLHSHGANVDSLNKVVVGDGICTLFQYLRGNAEVPWNVLVLLRDWMSVLNETGFDMVDTLVRLRMNGQEF